MALNWTDKVDGVNDVLAEDINNIAQAVIENENSIKQIPKPPTKTSELTNDSGFITKDIENLTNYYNKTYIDTTINEISQNIYPTIISIENLGSIRPNKVYSLTTSNAQTLSLDMPEDKTVQNQILVYLKVENEVEIVWGDNVVFVDGNEIPTIVTGAYRIIFEYNPTIEKWVVGVIQDGAVN